MHSKSYFIICLILITLFISTQSNTVKIVLDCIKDKYKKINDLNQLCKLNDTACIKTVYGMKQCFVNNQCYSQSMDSQMDVHCWNCWADYMTDSDVISSFQDNIRYNCKWENHLTTIFVVIFSIFALILGNA